jgi:hypothetical protein
MYVRTWRERVVVCPRHGDFVLAVRPPPNPENLVENGGFENPELLLGYAHLPPNALPAWQTTDDSFEVWFDGNLSVEGLQHLEILSHAATATVWQTVTIIPGEDYTFSFYHSPRPGVDSISTVAIDYQVLATFSQNGSDLTAFEWQRFRTNFTASSDSTTISLSDASAAASGTHVDNIALVRLPLRATLRVSERR